MHLKTNDSQANRRDGHLFSQARYRALVKIRDEGSVIAPPEKRRGRIHGIRRNVFRWLAESGLVAPVRAGARLKPGTVCAITGRGLNRLARTERARNKRRPGTSRKWCHDVAIPYVGDGCLLWPFGLQWNGLARMWFNGSLTYASRYICRAVHGEPPTSRHQASSSCGNVNRGCVNPKHLCWRTPSESQRNRRKRYRKRLLTPDQVIRIRALSVERPAVLAAQFKVHECTIRQIRNGRRWGGLVEAEHLELRRFYHPISAVAHNGCLVPFAEATQESTAVALYAAMDRLHPAVKDMLIRIIGGARLEEAAAESGIGTGQLAVLLPRLGPWLRRHL
jgi:hypothetical protein